MGKRRGFKEYLQENYLELDQYGYQFQMNMNGKTQINTYWGASISFVIILFMIGYTSVRVEALQTKKNTEYSSILVSDHIDHEEKFDFEENNFQLAFNVINAKTETVLDDPDYVEWRVWIARDDLNGNESDIDIAIHKCTA